MPEDCKLFFLLCAIIITLHDENLSIWEWGEGGRWSVFILDFLPDLKTYSSRFPPKYVYLGVCKGISDLNMERALSTFTFPHLSRGHLGDLGQHFKPSGFILSVCPPSSPPENPIGSASKTTQIPTIFLSPWSKRLRAFTCTHSTLS